MRGELLYDVVLHTYLFHLVVLKNNTIFGDNCVRDIVPTNYVAKGKHGNDATQTTA